MIKKTAIFSAQFIHVIHLLVRDTLIALVVLGAILFVWLIRGIEIDRFQMAGYGIEGLYLKLDKKLTLDVETVTIPRKKASPSFSRVDATFDNIKHVLQYFDRIRLHKIRFDNNVYTFDYRHDTMHIANTLYDISGKIVKENDTLKAKVQDLYIKRFDLHLRGTLQYDLDDEVLQVEGQFEWFDAKGRFRAIKRGEKIVYALNSDAFGEIAPIVRKFGLPSRIEEWIGNRVSARHYRVAYLKGEFVPGKDQLRHNLMRMKAQVVLQHALVRFKDGLKAVIAPQITVRYKQGALYFDLSRPTYASRDLNGSTVSIRHLISRKAILKLDIRAKTPVDEEIEKIVEAYGLHIPVRHVNPNDRVHVALKIPLYRKHKPEIEAKVDVSLAKGVAHIADLVLPVASAEAHYRDGIVTIEKTHLRERWYEIDIPRGEIDVRKKGGRVYLDLKRIALGEKKRPFLVIKNKKAKIDFSYNDPIRIRCDELGLTIAKSSKSSSLDVALEDLHLLLPYVRVNTMGVFGGHLNVHIDRDGTLRFEGAARLSGGCLFIGEKGGCVAKIPFVGTYMPKNERLIVDAFGKKLHYDTKSNRLDLNGIGIDLKRFLALRSKVSASQAKQSFASKKDFVVVGKKSLIRYNQYRLVTDTYDITIKPNGDIVAYGSLDGDVVKLTKKGKIFHLQALRIKDAMLHPLINFTGLKGGRYSIDKKGDPDTLMYGRIIVEGGVLSDFKAYNNTVAFINTLPALATLHDPGFSDKGFKIEKGVIKYRMTPKMLWLDSVYLKGKSATVVGKGKIRLDDGDLDIGLAIRTAREFGKLIGKIPVLGYILLGEDKSMTIALTVKGTLKKPVVRTSVAKDILTLPLQIIKRTLTLPAAASSASLPEIPDYVVRENKKSAETKATGSIRQPPKTVVSPVPTRSEAPSKDRSQQLF